MAYYYLSGKDAHKDKEGPYFIITTFNDESGNSIEFEVLDIIEYQGNNYVLLHPVEGDEDEVVCLRHVGDTNDESIFLSVDDEKLIQVLSDIFLNNLCDG